jgi:hypothetical protein
MTSCGSLARFSAQSVSMIPASGISTFTRKPSSCQNSLTPGQNLSGEPPTTSQRWVPERSMRILSTCGSRSCAVVVRACPERSLE